MNAVIYARYSSHNQREESIEDQLRVCTDFAIREGINIVGHYCDYAMTGTSDQRPDFQRMIKDSGKKDNSKKAFQAVIVYKQDRFVRGRYDAAIYKAALKKNGVKVISATEAIPDTPEGIITEALLEGMAEYYSVNLSQNIRRGLEGNARRCKPNGVKPFGYTIIDGDRYELDPVAAPLVKMIFTDLASGSSVESVIAKLNDSGVKTVRGNAWSQSSIANIRRNERYAGTYIFGKHRVPGGMPAIIDKETFRMAQKSTFKKSGQPEYLLSGKLYCAACGEKMIGKCGTGKSGQRHYYYVCKNQIEHTCTKAPIRRDFVEDTAIEVIEGIVQDDAIISLIADNMMELRERNLAESPLAALQDREAGIQRALGNLARSIERMGSSVTLEARLKALEDDLADVQSAIGRELGDKERLITRDMVVWWLLRYRDKAVDDPKRREYLTGTFLDRARLDENNKLLVLEFNFSDSEGNKCIKEHLFAEKPSNPDKISGFEDIFLVDQIHVHSNPIILHCTSSGFSVEIALAA